VRYIQYYDLEANHMKIKEETIQATSKGNTNYLRLLLHLENKKCFLLFTATFERRRLIIICKSMEGLVTANKY
jgi:hypothetical protein